MGTVERPLLPVELHGERLLLRPWEPADAPAVLAALQDPAMHGFTTYPFPYTAADAREFVEQAAPRARVEGHSLECAVVERGSGRLVGAAGMRLAGDPDIGYWVAPDAQGHGYAAEATRVLTAWAFDAGAARVRLQCDVRNLPSARTALAAGFRFEGVSRRGLLGAGEPPRRADLAQFARLPDDPPGAVPHAFAAFPVGGLADGVLALRPVVEADAPALAETDDELTLRWGFTGVAHTAAETRSMAAQAGLQWLVGSVAVLGMVDVATGRVAGSVRLRLAGPPGVGGIGYVVHPAFRGRGYTTRALQLLVPWALGPAGFARLELGAKAGNEASIRAAAAAGFAPDGVRAGRLRNPDGTYSDEVRLFLTR